LNGHLQAVKQSDELSGMWSHGLKFSYKLHAARILQPPLSVTATSASTV